MRYALLALLAGCSVMGHEPVANWPALQIIEHRVSQEAMVARCSRYVGFGMSPLGCAEFDFNLSRCHVWLTGASPNFVLQHERLHCAGYDHIGSTNMRDLLTKVKGQ
jgi:hypothetical protein